MTHLHVVRHEHLVRDVLVTHPDSLSFETDPRDEGVPFFCDWLSIVQVHPEGGLPHIDSGCVLALEADGSVSWKTVKAVRHLGSFETSLNLKCDGYRISFTGNVSRFGRCENLFGFGFWACLARINQVLAYYSLPPFTAGKKMEVSRNGVSRIIWTGARVSRIDLTSNYESGSADNAHSVLQFLGSKHISRKKSNTLGKGETVDWGSGSRRQYWKAYIKHIELIKHGCTDQRVIEYCQSRGIVRFEGTIRSNALTDIGAAFLGDYESGWAMSKLINLFEQNSVVMFRAEKATDDLSELPRAIRCTARDYLAGDDMATKLSRATFYRHRAALLSYGIDIAATNVRAFKPRIRVIELRPAEVPSWYQLCA